MVTAPEITAEEHPVCTVVDVEVDRGRPEDVACGYEGRSDRVGDPKRLVVGSGRQQLERGLGIGRGVQGERRVVPAEAAFVRESSLLLVNVCAVGEQDLAEVAGSSCRMDRAGESVTDEAGEPATVVDVGVREHDGIDGVRVDRKRVPVAPSELAHALEEASVDHHAASAVVDDEAAAGDGAGGAEESQQRGGHIAHARASTSSQRLAGCGSLTIITGHVACRMNPEVTLPSVSRDSPLRPWEDATISDACIRSAKSGIETAGCPSWSSSNSTRCPDLARQVVSESRCVHAVDHVSARGRSARSGR